MIGYPGGQNGETYLSFGKNFYGLHLHWPVKMWELWEALKYVPIKMHSTLQRSCIIFNWLPETNYHKVTFQTYCQNDCVASFYFQNRKWIASLVPFQIWPSWCSLFQVTPIYHLQAWISPFLHLLYTLMQILVFASYVYQPFIIAIKSSEMQWTLLSLANIVDMVGDEVVRWKTKLLHL